MDDLFIVKFTIYDIYCLTFLDFFPIIFPNSFRSMSILFRIQYFGVRGASYVPQDKKEQSYHCICRCFHMCVSLNGLQDHSFR